VYPNLKSQRLFLFGESYAGHYIPVFAYHIFKNQTSNGLHIDGIGIGDGLVEM